MEIQFRRPAHAVTEVRSDGTLVLQHAAARWRGLVPSGVQGARVRKRVGVAVLLIPSMRLAAGGAFGGFASRGLGIFAGANPARGSIPLE